MKPLGPPSNATPEQREALGIVWCPTCKMDTLPLDETGCCGFCNTVVATPTEPEAEPLDLSEECPSCQGRFTPSRPNQRYCDTLCRKRMWRVSPKGQKAENKNRTRMHAVYRSNYALLRAAGLPWEEATRRRSWSNPFAGLPTDGRAT